MVEVDKSEYEEFLASYPRALSRNVTHFCEPPVVTHNDFTIGDWPSSVVASQVEVWGRDYKPTGKVIYRIRAEKEKP